MNHSSDKAGQRVVTPMLLLAELLRQCDACMLNWKLVPPFLPEVIEVRRQQTEWQQQTWQTAFTQLNLSNYQTKQKLRSSPFALVKLQFNIKSKWISQEQQAPPATTTTMCCDKSCWTIVAAATSRALRLGRYQFHNIC